MNKAPSNNPDPQHGVHTADDSERLELQAECPRFVELLLLAEGERGNLEWTPPATDAGPRLAERQWANRTEFRLIQRLLVCAAAVLLVTCGVAVLRVSRDNQHPLSSKASRTPLTNSHETSTDPGLQVVDAESSGDLDRQDLLQWDDPAEQQLSSALQTLMYVNYNESPDERTLRAAYSAVRQLQQDVSQSGL